MTDIVILGAGPAGLAAAYRLARDGRSVVVLERSPVPGGLAGSFDVAGVRVDHGSHRLHPSCDPEILALLRGLLGGDLQRRPRHGRVRLAGRWVEFPPRPWDLARRTPVRFAVGVARDAFSAPWRRPPAADTFSEVVRARLGPTMAGGFYLPYVRKIWGLDPASLSGELARRRVGTPSTGALLRRALRRRGVAGRVFYYPRRGYGQICERLAAAAAGAGADLRFRTDVVRVEAGPERVRAWVAGGAGLEAGQAWSALPLPVLARLTEPPASPGVRAAAGRLEFRALLLVYVAFDRPRWTEYDAHYFPGPDAPFSRVSEPKNYRDGRGADPADRTVVCAEVPCSVGDARWATADADLGALVVDGFARQRLPAPEPVEVVVRRVPRAYPVYRAGFEADFAALDGWAQERARLLTFGRQGLFAHDNTHHALAMGWAAAAALQPDGSLGHQAWAASREVFAGHVVED